MAHDCRLGHHWPTRVRSRDAAGHNFATLVSDRHLLCGAVVAGPWVEPGNTTDAYMNDRGDYRASAIGLELSGGVLCAFLGYAAPDVGAFDHCDAAERSPLDGRGTVHSFPAA